VTNAHIVNSFD